MTEVYINNQRVIPKEDSSFKLNIENAFFEDSGSYTLDVTFPLHIAQNRLAFGAMNRIEKTKRHIAYEAMIIVGLKMVFKGTAKITSVNDQEVKLQFLSGKSHVKFKAREEEMYIDEFEYEYQDDRTSFDDYVGMDGFYGTSIIVAGTFPGKKGIFCYVPVLEENDPKPAAQVTNGLWNEHQLLIRAIDQTVLYNGGTPESPQYYIEVNRDCICPNLMFVTRWIFNHLGYTINRNDRANEFVEGIYIVTARHTTNKSNRADPASSSEEMAMAKALPHWTVEEFIKQLQNFLNATIVFNDIDGTVDIIGSSFTDGITDITSDVEDEYEVEVIEDADVAANIYDSNVKYQKGESEYHDLDMVEHEIISSFDRVKCSYNEALAQWGSMPDNEKKTTIWITEKGLFCAKIIEGEHGTETLEMIRFNHFGSIIRNEDNDNDIELKISPVATTCDIDMLVFEYNTAGSRIYRATEPRWTCRQTVLCLQNPYMAADKSTVWDAINGSRVEEVSKEDIMQVFLMDNVAIRSGFYDLPYQMPFTHPQLNVPNQVVPHRSWSLALANDNSENYPGKCHQNARAQNRNAEYRFKFKAKTIPSVYSVFYVRNKRYACKKLEVQFTNDGMDNIIMGYFEELTE